MKPILPVLVVALFSSHSVVAQFTQQGLKQVGSGASGSAHQGRSVSISANGDTVVEGGPFDNSFLGAAWVFTRTAGSWSQQGLKLAGSPASAGAFQGSAVAVSGDGSTLIIGGNSDTSGVGAAWVFTRSGSVWSQQGGKMVPSDVTGAAQVGTSVALSNDGNTAIVGGLADNTQVGAAWVFTRSGTTWSQQGLKLVGSGATGNANQGSSVALSADGNTAFIGGQSDNSNVGAAWVFTRSGTTWSQLGSKLVGSLAGASSSQGTSVALSADGLTAIVGGSGTGGGVGAAWIYILSGGLWVEQAKIVGTGVSGTPGQGASVSISSNGNTAVVGGPGDTSNTGAMWVFTRAGTVWSQQSKLVGTVAAAGQSQGTSVALSADGQTAVEGGQGDTSSAGAVWFFATPSAPVELRRFRAD